MDYMTKKTIIKYSLGTVAVIGAVLLFLQLPKIVEGVQLQQTKSSIEELDKQMKKNSENWEAYEAYIQAEKSRIKQLQNALELENRELKEEKKVLQNKLVGDVDFMKHQNQ